MDAQKKIEEKMLQCEVTKNSFEYMLVISTEITRFMANNRINSWPLSNVHDAAVHSKRPFLIYHWSYWCWLWHVWDAFECATFKQYHKYAVHCILKEHFLPFLPGRSIVSELILNLYKHCHCYLQICWTLITFFHHYSFCYFVVCLDTQV